MKRFVCMSAFFLTVSFGAGLAGAADEEPGTVDSKTPDLFEKLDRNGDGKLVDDEIPTEQRRFFERLVRVGDQDGNGELSRSEFTRAADPSIDQPQPVAGQASRRNQAGGRIPAPQDIMKQFDRNQDGKLSREEMPEPMRERLGKFLEQTGRDALTVEDLEKLRRGFEGRPQPQPQTPATQSSGNSPGGLFDRFDRNKDGKVTVDEVPEAARRMIETALERAGRGRDGALTREDFARLSAQSRNEGASRPDTPQTSAAGNLPQAMNRPGAPGNGRSEAGATGSGATGAGFFRLLDANDDGRLDRSELSKAAVLIERLDRNNDGTVDRQELFGPGAVRDGEMRPDGQRRPTQPERTSNDRPRRPEADSESQKPGSSAGRPSTGTAGEARRRPSDSPGQRDVEANFRRMDRNKDNAIDRDEAPERLRDNFDRIDANSDGRITLNELRKMLERSN